MFIRRTYDIPFCKGTLSISCSKRQLDNIVLLLNLVEFNGKDFYQFIKDKNLFNPDEELDGTIINMLDDNKRIGF